MRHVIFSGWVSNPPLFLFHSAFVQTANRFHNQAVLMSQPQKMNLIPHNHFNSVVTACEHSELCCGNSRGAFDAGFFQQVHSSPASGKDKDQSICIQTFPAPLILPDDELWLDPEYPPQSILSWSRDKERNAVTRKRNIIYIVQAPSLMNGSHFTHTWTRPKVHSNPQSTASAYPDTIPLAEKITEYLSAFYHPLAVKQLPSPLSFTEWNDDPPITTKRQKQPPSSYPDYIGLRTSIENIRIRTRPCPDSVFPRQLNVNDLLDVAISILPSDAYALLLLTRHDLYEEDDDIFVCGRAYGGSRVAVISTARYNPLLDDIHSVDREHTWPASHCSTFIESCCSPKPAKLRKKSRPEKVKMTSTVYPNSSVSPLRLALACHTPAPAFQSLHLFRTCLTSSHELAHCFGIDHCVYYACCMQGSASLAEDARQPPYLCPVDLEKILRATGGDKKERYKRLLHICSHFSGDESKGPWKAFEAWLQGRLTELTA